MHRVFEIGELVEHILLSESLSHSDLFHFGLTCSIVWPIAARVLWGAANVTLDMLEPLLPEFLSYEANSEGSFALDRPLTELEWITLKQYTQHVHVLHVEDVLQHVNASFDIIWTLDPRCFKFVAILESFSGPSPLFSNLRRLIFCGQSGTLSNAVKLLAGSNIVDLHIEQDYNPYVSGLHTSEDALALDSAARITAVLGASRTLKRFDMIIRGYVLCQELAMGVPTALSALQNLEHVKLSFLYRVTNLALLHAVALLPHLRTVNVGTLHISSTALRAEPLPTPAFPSLQSFILSLSLRNGATPLSDVLHWLAAAYVPHMHFTADDRDSSILGKRLDSGEGKRQLRLRRRDGVVANEV